MSRMFLRNKQLREALPLLTLLIIFLAAAAVYSSRLTERNTAHIKHDIALRGALLGPVPGDVLVGNPGAHVVVIEYMDLECPYCKVFENRDAPALHARFASSSVAFVYRQFPLTQIHPTALERSKLFICLLQRGIAPLSAMSTLYDAAGSTDDEVLREASATTGISAKELAACAASPEVLAAVNKDKQRGSLEGVYSTPSFVVYVDGIEFALLRTTLSEVVSQAIGRGLASLTR